jgi:uncharacterized protein
MAKIVWNVIVVAIVFYMGLLATLFIQQRSMMYLPDTTNPSPSTSSVPEMTEIQILTRDGKHNEAWMYFPDDASAKVVVMFHGNASNVGGRAEKARHFIDAGYGFVLTGYRGYGGNIGEPDEDGLYEDARAVMKDLTVERGISPSRIVLYGESLGSGVATKMAAEYPDVAGLVLEVPFDSALDVARARYWYVVGLGVLMRDQYRSDQRIGKLKMPKLIIAAGKDEVIAPRHAKHLYMLASEPKKFIEIPGGSHNNLYDFGLADQIIGFIQILP